MGRRIELLEIADDRQARFAGEPQVDERELRTVLLSGVERRGLTA